MLGAFREVLQVARQLEHEQRAKVRRTKAEREVEEAAAKAAAEAEKEGKDPKEAAKEARKKAAAAIEEAELEAKKAEGAEPDAYQGSQKELLAMAEASPRKLVAKMQPCPGLLASYARYSPEVGEYGACGAVFLN